MSGNVWEWTRSLWGEDFKASSFPYPYVAGDGRENQEAPPQIYRVVRGGAFDDDFMRTRCAFRVRFLQDTWKSGVGFRIVLAS